MTATCSAVLELLPWFVGDDLCGARRSGARAPAGLLGMPARSGGPAAGDKGAAGGARNDGIPASGSGIRGFEGHAGCRRTDVRCDARFDRAGGADGGGPVGSGVAAHVRDALAAAGRGGDVDRSRLVVRARAVVAGVASTPDRPALDRRRACGAVGGRPRAVATSQLRGAAAGRRLRQRRRARHDGTRPVARARGRTGTERFRAAATVACRSDSWAHAASRSLSRGRSFCRPPRRLSVRRDSRTRP